MTCSRCDDIEPQVSANTTIRGRCEACSQKDLLIHMENGDQYVCRHQATIILPNGDLVLVLEDQSDGEVILVGECHIERIIPVAKSDAEQEQGPPDMGAFSINITSILGDIRTQAVGAGMQKDFEQWYEDLEQEDVVGHLSALTAESIEEHGQPNLEDIRTGLFFRLWEDLVGTHGTGLLN